MFRKISNLPPEVEVVFREFRTCEMSTLARDGTPITWPTLPFWRPEERCFLITTSIGLPHKAFNVRRNPRVSLLFSNPTASGLTEPPAMLVQGDAEAPASGFYSSNPITRYLFDWYYMRLTIYVSPRRILWWPKADFGLAPFQMYHVG